jgi:polysaccharide pyruvyl transferase WcaK-like protein
MQMSPEDAGVHAEFFAALSASAGKPGLPDAPPLASWPEMTGIAASAGLVIGMRLHALILAAANGVPSVALAYDPKIAAFMVQTGQSDAVFDIRDPDPGKLAHVIRQCWEQRAERAELLRERLPNLKAAANQNAEIAMGLIGR